VLSRAMPSLSNAETVALAGVLGLRGEQQ